MPGLSQRGRRAAAGRVLTLRGNSRLVPTCVLELGEPGDTLLERGRWLPIERVA